MRIKAPIAVSAVVLAGLVSAGSTNARPTGPDPRTPAPLLAASTTEQAMTGTVGFVPSAPRQAVRFREVTPAGVPFTAAMPLKDVAMPGVLGALGIPEIVLAAYRNAELALAASEPGCGISWNLLAGIGRIESGHAGGGRTDVAGTTLTRVLGPVLDGTLADNAVIRDTDAGALDGDPVHDRAIGPMQFIPGTWRAYASDGNADGVADPNNVFDAALSAGKYLCSGGLDLRDPAQELRAVLRYNNSMAYAANVLSWSAAYRTGGTPSPVAISADLVPPGTSPIDFDALARSADATVSATTTPEGESALATTTREMVITVPGMAPVPCGIFCPPDYVPQPGDWRQLAQTTTPSATDDADPANQANQQPALAPAPETPAVPLPAPPETPASQQVPVEQEAPVEQQPVAPPPLIPGLPFQLPVFPPLPIP